ncbi:type IV secretion protein Rhs [Actinoplanes italicus]|uniref:RHS repeat-associated protein n=1 Tax=Actinoplanes italicus TaxID=113567 RepID=A0A2T0KFR2_9ACTN|nr:RHS repeat-associated core domain-containing protein [Actinoplanes italicus]PRX22189.1 RHS repeat-associated protein [Actinoplanes italicus]GIE29391.1 type IV secretion protein Rhs [Actinoplanes italicus]
MTTCATLSVLLLADSVAVASPASRGAASPKPVPPPAVSPGRAVDGVFEVKPKTAAKTPDPAEQAFTPTATKLPSAARASIRLNGAAKARAAGSPVWAQAAQATTTAAVSEVDVQVLGQDKARRLGIDGVVLSASSAKAGRARLGLDYAGFAEAYGGNFASRLRLVRLPSCALTTPEVAACRKPAEVAGTNDARTQSVSAVVDVPAEQSLVLAAVASAGESGAAGGSYAATKLSPTGTWAGGGSTGGFSYSYPVTVPPAASGLVPGVALSYNSSGVDGQTVSTQAQANWAGDGWSTPESYIEQTFVSCSEKPQGKDAPKKIYDQCHNGPILTMSLDGRSSSLVWDETKKVYKAEDDNGEVITKVAGGDNGSGAKDTSYWQVTMRNGAVFQFGRNQLPGWTSGKPRTNSVDTVPVYSPFAGDPCYDSAGFDKSWCTTAYRWNLDYTKDAHGNAMAYYYHQDTNVYGRYEGATKTSYVRDSWLERIDYGFTDGNAYGTVANQVVFGTGDRCVSGTCQPLNSTNKANWPDVPFDLICAPGAECDNWSPSFFATVRLASITTKQYSTATGQHERVDAYTLAHTMPATGDGTSPTLWLNSITRSAYAGSPAITLPSVTFSSEKLQNRVDTVTDGLPAFYRHRVQQIKTESGSVITVTYGRKNACTAPVTLAPATNTSACYPVRWTPPLYTEPFTDWFNKYVVTKVTQTDPTGGAAAHTTSYDYLGGAGWHYDVNELVKPKYRTYGQFRGYGKVQTRVGDLTNDKQTLSEATYFRGMSKNNNTTVVQLTDSQGGKHEDLDDLSGRVLESTSYRGDGGPAESSTINTYWISAPSATRTRTGVPALNATWISQASTFQRQRINSGGTPSYRLSQTNNSYDDDVNSSLFGTLQRTYTHSVPVDAKYDTCVTNTYAPINKDRNIVGLLAEVDVVSKACGGYTAGSQPSAPGNINTLTAPTGVNRPAQVVSNERYFYDDPEFSTTFPQAKAPTRGARTMERHADGWNGSAYTYKTTSRAEFDSYGHTTAAYDANGTRTRTAYNINSAGLLTSTTITNVLEQDVTTTLDPRRQLTMSTTDANDVVTTMAYDALGRSTAVWLYSRTTDQPANKTFSYVISQTGLSSSTTQTLNESLSYVTSTEIYDGMLRPRQTQSMTPRGGRLVTDTFYDSRGWIKATYSGWWDDGNTPNTTLVSAADLKKQVDNQTLFTYDGLGRAVKQEQAKNNLVQPQETSTTVYSGDAVTVFPPAGGIVKTTYTDPLGRTDRIDDYQTRPTVTEPANTFTGEFTVTGGAKTTSTYGFNGQGLQNTITDKAGNTWSTTYNMLGQATEKSDPDAGKVTGLKYDGNGNLTQSTDSRSKTVSFKYDQLNRKIGSYASTIENQSDTNKLAEWVYDNSDNAVPGMAYPLGKLTSSTSYWGTGRDAYKVQQNNFNQFGSSRGATITIPAAEGTLAGTYTFSKLYTPNSGLLSRDVYPFKGGLPSETVDYGYSGVLDLPTTTVGLSAYGSGVTYDAWGRVVQQTFGSSPNYGNITNTWDPHTSRLTSQLISRQTGTPSNVNQTDFTYNAIGDIEKIVDTRLGGATPSETQCFRTDGLRRMRAAWTATDNCAVEPTEGSRAMVGSSLGAASAYWTTWAFNDLGDRTSQTKYSLSGGADTVTGYTYNGNGKGQPHTLTSTSTTGGSTGTTSYGYDTAGNMESRTAGNGNQTLTWDESGRLTAISGSTGGNTSFLYDADGGLLLQKDPGKTTLYLPGQQIVLNTVAGTQSGTRYYALPGGGAAIRTGTGSNYSFALADHHGTPSLYLNATLSTPTWRQYTPFGAARGAAGTYPDNRGFLNKVVNGNTGLIQVGARNYDPDTGRFISVDPIFDGGDRQSWNGYVYANNSPVTMSDPSGLRNDANEPSYKADAKQTVEDYNRQQAEYNYWKPIADEYNRQYENHQKAIREQQKCQESWWCRNKSTIVGGAVGVVVGLGCGAAIGWTGVGAVGCGAAAGAAGSFVTGWMDGQRGWDLAGTTAVGGLFGAALGGAGSIFGSGIKGAFGAAAGGRISGFISGALSEMANIGKGVQGVLGSIRGVFSKSPRNLAEYADSLRPTYNSNTGPFWAAKYTSPSGKVYYGKSGHDMKPQPGGVVESLVSRFSPAGRVHTGCAETMCLIKAEAREGAAGVRGGHFEVVRVRAGDSHGRPGVPCPTVCQPRLNAQEITY